MAGFELREYWIVHTTYLLAKAAVDALGHIDIVACGAARAILARLCLNGNCLRRADGFAQLARNTPFLACTR